MSQSTRELQRRGLGEVNTRFRLEEKCWAVGEFGFSSRCLRRASRKIAEFKPSNGA